MSLARQNRQNILKKNHSSLQANPSIYQHTNNSKARANSNSPNNQNKILTRNTSLLNKKTTFKFKTQSKPIQKMKTSTELLDCIKNIMNENNSFQILWGTFSKTLTDHFKFIGLSIKPISQIGEKLAKNGEFIIKFYQLISKDSFVNPKIACKTVYKQYQNQIEQKKELFNSYFQEKISTTTPQKISEQLHNSLKRSILKSRSIKKNVSFPRKSHQIKYPMNIEYSNQKNYSVQKKKSHRKRIHQPILQFLEIDEFLLLGEIEIIGVISEKPHEYAQILFKHLITNEEKKGLCLLTQTINQFELKKLETIQKKTFSFVDLQGKDIKQVWLDSV